MKRILTTLEWLQIKQSSIGIQLEMLDSEFDYYYTRLCEVTKEIYIEKILELCRTGK
jgi:hypothetical protein